MLEMEGRMGRVRLFLPPPANIMTTVRKAAELKSASVQSLNPLQAFSRTPVIAATLALIASGPAGAFTYTVSNIGLYVNNGARALAVNNSGQMGGFSTVGLTSTKNAFVGSGVPNVALTNLHNSGGSLLGGFSGSYAAGINESGQVVGQALRTNQTAYVPFISTAGGAMTEVNPLGGTVGGTARDINNNGVMVGSGYVAGNSATHAYTYDTTNNSSIDIGSLISGSGNSEAYAINDSGQVAGAFFNAANTVQRAFIYDVSGVTDLGTLGGLQSAAIGINGSGEVVGWSLTAGNATHGFIYNGITMTDIGTLNGGTTKAQGINDSGQVVGFSASANVYGQSAFIYQDGVMTDLNTLIDPASGMQIIDAYAVSNTGYIVASAYMVGNPSQGAAVLLAPLTLIPEPSSLIMLVAGIAGVVTRRRR
jgi:probable HAF family extracellular repeat protein